MGLTCAGTGCMNLVPPAPVGVFPRVIQARYCGRVCRDKPIRRRGYLANRQANMAKSVAYRQANLSAVQAQRRQHRATHPEKQVAWNRVTTLRRKYGLTLADFEHMNAAQHGLCAICGQPETARGRGGNPAPLSVDHDHATGRVRALLCRRCNGALGVVERTEWLEDALGYLRQHKLSEVS